jgi:hypothetical protein
MSRKEEDEAVSIVSFISSSLGVYWFLLFLLSQVLWGYINEVLLTKFGLLMRSYSGTKI